MGTSAGRRKVSASPTSAHASPLLNPIPRIKLSIRNTPPSTPNPSHQSLQQPIKRKVGRPRKDEQRPPIATSSFSTRPKRSTQRPKLQTKKSYHDSGSSDSSDLSSLDEVDDMEVDDDDTEPDVTPRKKNPVGRPKSSEKGKERALQNRRSSVGSPTVGTSGTAGGAGVGGSASKVTVSGPAGRVRRKAIKLEEAGRRRARDAKFDVEDLGYGGPTPTQNSPTLGSYVDSDDSMSSFGDDESDHFLSGTLQSLQELEGYGMESDDDNTRGLPEAFAGQDIEDLAYGAIPELLEPEPEPVPNWWIDDDEEMLIANLSGSEAEQQSQSSANSDTQSDYQHSTSDSEPEEEIDEFGFPVPSSSSNLLSPTEGEAPLVLMENWDGQFVLVQPRQERSRSSKRRGSGSGSRASRTNGSVAGSTIAASELPAGDDDEMNLVIDPEAVAAEFHTSSSSEWSGVSDEDEGDTTDSMDEDDMPMLDSPAMQELIEQQIGMPSPGLAMMDTNPLDGASLEVNGGAGAMGGPPAIVVTDTTVPETPALSSTSTNTPNISGPSNPVPQTPGNQPIMGTFLPTSTDPAQHAVIDGSKTTTKSPFTHRRRFRKGRADSMSSAGMGSTISRQPSMIMAGIPDRKRRSHTASVISDPFASPVQKVKMGLSKKARYTSIPGHPKYVAAQRQAYDEQESTASEEEAGELELEDMLESSLLDAHSTAMGYELAHAHGHGHGGRSHGAHGFDMRHLIRFDRVPMSTYIKRNLGSGNPGILGTGGSPNHQSFPDHFQHNTANGVGHSLSSPIRPVESLTGIGMGGQEGILGIGSGGDTLMAETTPGLFISPLVGPVIEEQRGRSARRVPELRL